MFYSFSIVAHTQEEEGNPLYESWARRAGGAGLGEEAEYVGPASPPQRQQVGGPAVCFPFPGHTPGRARDDTAGGRACQGLCILTLSAARSTGWQGAAGALHTLAQVAALGLQLHAPITLSLSVALSVQPSQTPLSPTWGALTGYPGAVGLRAPGATPVKRFAPVMYPTRQAPSESAGPQQGQQAGEGQ